MDQPISDSPWATNYSGWCDGVIIDNNTRLYWFICDNSEKLCGERDQRIVWWPESLSLSPFPVCCDSSKHHHHLSVLTVRISLPGQRQLNHFHSLYLILQYWIPYTRHMLFTKIKISMHMQFSKHIVQYRNKVEKYKIVSF